MNIGNASEEEIRLSLVELGDGLAISAGEDIFPERRDLKICISTGDPTLVFDACSQFGKLKSVKIN